MFIHIHCACLLLTHAKKVRNYKRIVQFKDFDFTKAHRLHTAIINCLICKAVSYVGAFFGMTQKQANTKAKTVPDYYVTA